VSNQRVTAEQRRIVITRAKQCCEYCVSQVKFATESFSVEHIIPRIKEGKTELDNLALSCQGCNNFKHTKTEGLDPITGKVVPLFHPRQQAWQDRFAWDDDYTLIVGITPTGRATVTYIPQVELENLKFLQLFQREGFSYCNNSL
jgi:hypothetical protein